MSIFKSIEPFPQYTFTQSLLCVRTFSKGWGQSSEYEKVLHGAYKIERNTHTHIQKLIHDIKEKKKNSQVALVVKNPPAMQETQEMGCDPRVGKIPLRRKWQSTPLPAWRISWTQGPGRLPTGLLRVTDG